MAQSSMTDKQVLEYIRKGVAAGKEQKEMMQELVLKGVDRAQAARVKKLYEKELSETQETKTTTKDKTTTKTSDRLHIQNPDFIYNTEEDGFLTEEKDSIVATDSIEVFGRNIFRNKNVNFAPNTNMATPKNYVIGPGDEVIVDVFGANQSTIRSIVSPEGYINVDILGPIYVSGKTIEKANAFLKNKLSSIYDGLNGDDAMTDIQLSLGQIRTIQVNIIGEVENPGTYMVSSLSTVFHALFLAGGVKGPGTLRAIKLIRDNHTITTIDLYDFLINGSRKNDIRLEEEDVILVEPYTSLVKASGLVRRPIYFEMKNKETLADLLKYAGGFDKGAYTENVSIARKSDRDSIIAVIEKSQYDKFILQDGDEVKVRNMEARYKNRIYVAGAVFMPGIYELNKEVNSVKKLIEKAGGLMPEAFTQRALIHRENDDKTLEKFAVDLDGIINGRCADVALRNNDSIYVNSHFELSDFGTLTINGEVADPGIFPFAKNTTIQDLILQAGGLLRSASTVRVDVARKVFDQESLVAQSDISTYYVFSIREGLAIDGADTFVLQPYDVVTVRKSPSYVENRTITIKGEVNFPGIYNMSKREERISDLIAKAGNVTDFAYIKGARLTRKMTEEEKLQYQNVALAMENSGDSIKEEKKELTYLVSFDLEDAIKHPGGDNDIVLRQEDVLEIPVYNNTVRIDGAVQMPTTLSYRKGLDKRTLVNAAGGYGKRAYKHKAFIVYMNGRVARLGRFTKIEPGCQVFIPKKDKKTGQLQQALSISTAAASLGMMGVSIANLLK